MKKVKIYNLQKSKWFTSFVKMVLLFLGWAIPFVIYSIDHSDKNTNYHHSKTPSIHLIQQDSLALVELYNNNGGENWTYTATTYEGLGSSPIPNAGTPWDFSTPISTWHGVGVNTDGCVTILAINDNGLTGGLPDLNLSHLEFFDCSLNQISGSIPDFSHLINLRYFICRDNLLSSIPNFSNLGNLEVFKGQRNVFSGTIPNFSNLPNLHTFSCARNQLTGQIPDFDNLPNLGFFTCRKNQLTGEIPTLENLTSLSSFICDDNQLTGEIPVSSTFENLFNFACNDNQLSGCFPAYVCNLTNFNASNNPQLPWQGDHTLFCSGNDQVGASCDDGHAYSSGDVILSDCSCNGLIACDRMNDSLALVELYNSINGLDWNLNQPINSWTGVTLNIEGCVTHLELSNSNLSGQLIDFVLPSLQSFNCSLNQLSGSIPNFTNLPTLEKFLCFNNQLTGVIPDFSNCPNLTTLDCDINQLTGEIPDFSSLTNLKFLLCDNNQLSGTIPDLPNLDTFWCYNNYFTFEGLLPYFTSNILSINEFIYFPQNPIYVDTTININEQEDLMLDLLVDESINNNEYSWFKNGVPYTTIIGNNNLNIPSIQLSDNGTYTVRVSNPEVPDLILESYPIEIIIQTILSPCHTQDSLELVELYNNTGGPDWTYEATIYYDGTSNNPIPNAGTPWDFNTPISTWHGVEVNADGCVTKLALTNNGLTGELLDFNIPTLEVLNCSSNQISGVIPNFSHISNLLYFDCSSNLLSGSIPDFDNLIELLQFRCANNQLTGSIPDFSNMPNLEEFRCQSNQLNDFIPNFSNLTNLSIFRCTENKLIGNIPNFTNLPNLIHLYCGENLLTGEIPNFSNLPQLVRLICNNNLLEGNIPEFTNLNNVSIINCQVNQLSGEIPNFDYLANLSEFNCYDNQLIGCFPDFVCDINIFDASNNLELPWEGDHTNFCNGNSQMDAPCDDGNINTINDNIQTDCSCFGTIAPSCAQIDSLSLVELYNSTGGENWINKWNLSDPMENWYGVTLNSDGCVICLDLDGNDDCTSSANNGNNLNGTIPDLNLMNLQTLSLSENQLSGNIPNFSNLPNLIKLWCDGNNLSGNIPNFSNLANLEEFECANNLLTGSIPDFNNLPNLRVLWCSYNQLIDEIPNFNNLPNLQTLACTWNNLSGEIPNFTNLANLKILRCGENELVGNIPDFINLPNLQTFDCSRNLLVGLIPNFTNLPSLQTFSCNENQLTGEIPNFSQLLNFQNFNCSDNNLTGCFPDFICDLSSFDATGNLQLPWEGNHINFCLGLPQIGAICNDGIPSTINDSIQANCSCNGIVCIENNLSDTIFLCSGEIYTIGISSYNVSGVYIDTLSNILGCDSIVTTNLNIGPNNATIDFVAPSCHDSLDGVISIVEIESGTPPFLYTLNNSSLSTVNHFENLGAGTYSLLVEDSSGCQIDTSIILQNPDEIQIIIDPISEIEAGENITITANTNIPNSIINDIFWSPSDGLSCVYCLETVAAPNETTTYNITITDTNGCITTQEIIVSISDEPSVYEFISPYEKDGNNDLWIIPNIDDFPENEVIIFNRWGSIIYQAKPYSNNTPWDGTNEDGKLLPQGVYYFIIRYSLSNPPLIKKGRVMLVK